MGDLIINKELFSIRNYKNDCPEENHEVRERRGLDSLISPHSE
jgi:hypothetical protein